MKSNRNKVPQQLSPAPSFLAARAPQFCLLCGGPQNVIGIYVPGDSEAWGAPKGKDRRFIYALCDRCFGKPDAPIRVEKVILSELHGGRSFPCPGETES